MGRPLRYTAALAAGGAATFAYGFMFAVQAPARMMPFTVPVVTLAALIIWALPPGNYAPTKALEPILRSCLG